MCQTWKKLREHEPRSPWLRGMEAAVSVGERALRAPTWLLLPPGLLPGLPPGPLPSLCAFGLQPPAHTFLAMDLGAPEGKVSMETSPLRSLPSALQTPRVGGNLDKLVNVKFENPHAGQIDDQVGLLRTSGPWEHKPGALRQSSHCQEIWLTSLSWSS